MNGATRKLAVVTGASSGIGYELAKCAARDGFDLVVAAENPGIHEAAANFRALGVDVTPVQANLATMEGVETLVGELDGRPVEVLMANAGRGLGRAFIEQDFGEIRNVIDTNVTGTLYLLHKMAREMRDAGHGRILITGSIAGLMPGTYQAVYNGSKAFLDSFAFALRHELKDSGVSVTVLMPGATETEFFERADMMDTKVGTAKKDDPADVAAAGYKAMMQGKGEVVSGWQNKLQAAIAHITPAGRLAEMHAGMAAPGTAK
jgi:short-subunit dehydrogenase